MSEPQTIVNDLRQTRLYTKQLLSHIDDSDWFRQPTEGVTHVAWQVGHLAVTQYGLALKRQRGEREEDADLISPEFRTLFGKGSTPIPDPSAYPSPQDIRAVLDRVHEQAIAEVSAVTEDSLQEPVGDPPHPMFSTKLESLQWCVRHEFTHVGQITLLRRLFGAEPLR